MTIHRLDKLIEIKTKESEAKLKIKEEQVQATRELNATIKEAIVIYKIVYIEATGLLYNKFD